MSADFKFIRSSVIRLRINSGVVLNGFDMPRRARLDRRAVVMFRVLAPAQVKLTVRLNGTPTTFFVGPGGERTLHYGISAIERTGNQMEFEVIPEGDTQQLDPRFVVYVREVLIWYKDK